jgi:hypothetical protein
MAPFKPRVIPALPMQHEAIRSASAATMISLRTARKIRLRISLDAAGWFHNRGKSSRAPVVPPVRRPAVPVAARSANRWNDGSAGSRDLPLTK